MYTAAFLYCRDRKELTAYTCGQERGEGHDSGGRGEELQEQERAHREANKKK